MYRSDLNGRDKSGAIAAVIAIHGALLLAWLFTGHRDAAGDRSVTITRLVDFKIEKQPLPPQQHRSRQSGGSTPDAKSEAAPVTALRPHVVMPPVQQITVSETPQQGTQSTPGAENPGSGTGAGAGRGAGKGIGEDDQVADGPHLATPVLSGRDIPRETLDQWPRGATVFMRLRIDARGYVSECTVDRGTGLPAVDSTICNLAHERLRFRPAVNRNGQPVAGWFGYAQPAPR